jgi:hypothetical protein
MECRGRDMGEMWKRFGLPGLVIAIAIAGAAAAAPPDIGDLKRAADRGDRLYAYDQAAWISTDEMLRQLPDPKSAGVAGWIVEEKSDHLHVIYYRIDQETRAAVFTAEVVGKQVISSHRLTPSDNSALSPFELRLIHAREVAAASQKVTSCTGRGMNVVVLPPATEADPVPVYLLSAQVKTSEFPFGGHYEVDVGADGKVVSTRAFTKACLNMPAPPPSQPGKPAFAVVTHLLDVVPTEIHVYLSRWMGAVVVVQTPTTEPPTSEHRTWIVDGDQITLSKN